MDESPPPARIEPAGTNPRAVIQFAAGFVLGFVVLGAPALFAGAGVAFSGGAKSTAKLWALVYLVASATLLVALSLRWRRRSLEQALRPFEAGVLLGAALVALLASACGGCIAFTGPSRLAG